MLKKKVTSAPATASDRISELLALVTRLHADNQQLRDDKASLEIDLQTLEQSRAQSIAQIETEWHQRTAMYRDLMRTMEAEVLELRDRVGGMDKAHLDGERRRVEALAQLEQTRRRRCSGRVVVPPQTAEHLIAHPEVGDVLSNWQNERDDVHIHPG